MKVLMINSVCGIRSTGRICTDLAADLEKDGREVKIAYGRESVPEKFQKFAVRIGGSWDVRTSGLKARLFDNEGFNSVSATRRFLKWADEYNPDLLWLHNLHGYYINLELLFTWIKSRPQMQVKWCLHDCWAFTGHCPHFVIGNCQKWKTQCYDCPKSKQYPKSFFADNSRKNYQKKKDLFTGIRDMTLYVPTHWMENFVKESFLKEYPIEVVPHKVDTEIFHPRESDFRARHGLENKKIILGAATAWGVNKGLGDFIKLAGMLSEEYKIVLVGLTPKQMAGLPANILALPRTNHAVELAEIYTAADVFANPSKVESYGMTTVEAIACGTPAIVYENTACEEVIRELGHGAAVKQSAQYLYEAILERV